MYNVLRPGKFPPLGHSVGMLIRDEERWEQGSWPKTRSPDVTILCCSESDEMEMVERNMSYFETSLMSLQYTLLLFLVSRIKIYFYGMFFGSIRSLDAIKLNTNNDILLNEISYVSFSRSIYFP